MARTKSIAQKLGKVAPDEDPARVAGAIAIFATETIKRSANNLMEARAYLDLSIIPPRGRWGSPTAASLPVALKNAFMDAISRTRPRR